MVRDQANKTLEIYLQRVRKYAETLPETLQPPMGQNTAAGAAPRVGTPQSDSSWTGWAISSFTNKVGTTSGTMQENGSAPAGSEARSLSVPPSSSGLSKPASTSSIPGLRSSGLASRSSANPFPSPSPLQNSSTPKHDSSWDANGDEDDWDEEDEGAADATASAFAAKSTISSNLSSSKPSFEAVDEDEADDANEAWGAEAPKSSFANPVSFDDKGEPDFAGWLNAQSQSKGGKKPLPKGLAKTKSSLSSRPGLPKANSTGTGTGARASLPSVSKAGSTAKKKGEEAKKVDDAWADWD
jgi:SCY1-like protein 1